MFAHYFGKTVTISRDIEGRNTVAKFPGVTKREARKIAAQWQAKPWNF